MKAPSVPDVLRASMQRRYLVPIAIFIFFTAMLIGLKVVRLDQEHGDAALYYQLTDNIANRGVPATNISPAFEDSVSQQIPHMTAEQVSASALAPQHPAEINYFQLHANYVFYAIAMVAKIFPTRLVVLSLYVLSFTGLVLFAYFALCARRVPAVAAGLFCLLVVLHPAWSYGLTWQFYPERIFVLAGFAFMYLASKNDAGRTWLIVIGLLCASISERAAIMAGMFLVLYALLYWKIDVRDRQFKLGFGAALAAYGVLVLKLVIVNPEYSSFLPHNLAGLLGNFHSPVFLQNLGVFSLVNILFLAVAFFEWRAAIIAMAFMLPNVVGNLGGVEKVGWYAHYHDLYLPALVWAAFMGFVAAYRMAASRTRLPALYGATCVLILLLGCIDPYSGGKNLVTPANLANNFFTRFVSDSDVYFGPSGRALAAAYDLIPQTIPVGSVVSSPESTMAALYHGRTLRFFPVDIDHADYAILGTTRGAHGEIEYYGTIDYFIGAAEAHRVDQVLLARMRKDHYDFAHAVLIPKISTAIVKRIHPST